MTARTVSLSDRFDLAKHHVLLNGTQALARLMLAQKARDQNAGLNTAGFVTGYRGSPLGNVDFQMRRAQTALQEADILFQEGLNEDLAATAIWGSQQAELRGEGRFDGVFGLWYGKGPGVDRSGDAMRHANMAGSSQHGGVIMAMGDDHTGESSTVLHQSDLAMIDAYMPVLSPAGVQEILDLGHYAFALSRFSGLWTGLKVMKDTIEVTSVVDGDPHRMQFVTPAFDMPPDGLNIRLIDTPTEQEARLVEYKRHAAEAFARANRIDRSLIGNSQAKIGFVAAGKNWLDLMHAFELLKIDAKTAEALGISAYKIAQTWPLDRTSLLEWAEPLDMIVVVEEKRKLIETQVRETVIGHRKRVFGELGLNDTALFGVKGALDPVEIAQKLGRILCEEGYGSEQIKAKLRDLDTATHADNSPDLATRVPYFCAGCPHNSSTKIPQGSRAYAGIGCHYMVQWMQRETLGFTHMGAEGANWIGEAPFSKRKHVFQNIGDGTYNHSGIQAIRATVAAGTNITYKILYNDAVAMTGGQANDGGLGPERIAAELSAMGIENLAIIHDEKEDIGAFSFPNHAQIADRAALMDVQKKFAQCSGVSAILYIQTCAAEKRRRRKRNAFPDPDQRLFINTEICEGCGDCGVQSNCVAIHPVDTPLGRKRRIDQSACNKDFSCLNGFCPSFVTLKGAKPKKSQGRALNLPETLPDVALPQIDTTFNVVITGIGGTGVVTLGAILAQAAQIDGKGAGMMEMAGLAQKGGAVRVHCRLANRPEDISAIRVARGECDALIGGDLVVSAGQKTLGLTSAKRTGAVINSHEVMTGDFARDRDFVIPSEGLKLRLNAHLGQGTTLFDATELARAGLGDAIFANMIVLGAAWQQGLLPLTRTAIEAAIELNGTAVRRNLQAFKLGRWAIAEPQARDALLTESQEAPNGAANLDKMIATRAAHLRLYQNAALAERYTKLLAQIDDLDTKEIVARAYHKLLAYKDEYEVARLLLRTHEQAETEFESIEDMQFHLAPPFLSKMGQNGRPKKYSFGSWLMPGLRLLARMKHLRGTRWDIFGYADERRQERALIATYEQDLKYLLPKCRGAKRDTVLAILRLPLSIRGFGQVKARAMSQAAAERSALLRSLDTDASPQAAE